MKLDEKLVRLRKEKGLTQLELAEAVKVSRQAVSRWEVGVATPSTENLSCLSRLFGVSVDYLLNEENQEVREDASSEPKEECGLNISCKEGRKTTIRVIVAILLFLILAGSLILLTTNERKEEFFKIDEMIGEGVEPNRSFTVGW